MKIVNHEERIMTESQIALKARIGRNAAEFKRLLPEVAEPYTALTQEVYKDGYIRAKHKRLMALVGALSGGSRACILYQTEQALALGASPDEILEACSVALSLGGTMALGQITRVVDYLTEKELLSE